MKANWNFDPRQYNEIPIIKVNLNQNYLVEKKRTNNLRLLVYSHFIAFNEIPAFFLEKSPKYFSGSVDDSAVVIFDIDSLFTQSLLPEWAVIEQMTWNPKSNFQNDISDHFQRALTLKSYYKYRYLRPLYFTTFLLIPGNEINDEPFIYQQVPVLQQGALYLRTILQEGLYFLLNYSKSVSPGSYVLLPPFEHPFQVAASALDNLTLLYVNKSILSITPSKTPFVLLTRPPVCMPSYYVSDPQPARLDQTTIATNTNKPLSFPTTEFMKFSEEDIQAFFAKRFQEEQSYQERDTIRTFSILEYPDPDADEITSEDISDPHIRQIILDSIGPGNWFPIETKPVKMMVANFLSFFRFDFGFSIITPPAYAMDMMPTTPVEYTQLGIPNIVVNHDGKKGQFPADRVITEWESSKLLPLCGPKSGHYVVFMPQTMNKDAVKAWFTQFQHIYTELGFGTLRPFPRFDPYKQVAQHSISDEIDRFFKGQQVSEFQQSPILTFIVGGPIFDACQPHSIVTYIRPTSIATASEEEIKTLAFVVYSRIRLFAPFPFGMIDLAPNESATFLFGFRYEPPFILPRTSDGFVFHIGWDPMTNQTAWMDGIGTVLHVLNNTDLNKLHQLMLDIPQLLKNSSNIRYTISVLGSGITNEVLDNFHAIFAGQLENITLFSCCPSPAIQIVFDKEFDDDAMVFAPNEQVYAGDYAPPEITCYVLSQHHPPYKVSLYTKDDWKDSKTVITDYVTNMSHLSWCSVKPGSEKRTISYPPHICALLRKNNRPTQFVSRFEFLPIVDKI